MMSRRTMRAFAGARFGRPSPVNSARCATPSLIVRAIEATRDRFEFLALFSPIGATPRAMSYPCIDCTVARRLDRFGVES
jgi:hypothetical protein